MYKITIGFQISGENIGIAGMMVSFFNKDEEDSFIHLKHKLNWQSS